MNDATPQQKAKTVPKWESDNKDRIRSAIKKFSKPLADLCARDANEGDTRLLITDFLCEGLGYDKYVDLTTEYRVKGEFADFGIRIDQQMVAFIEVKRVNTKLSDKHLRQVQSYALNEGCAWVLLTNGHVWQIYHITAALPVVTDLVLEADMLRDQNMNHKVNDFFVLSREAMKRGLVNELYEARRATSPKSLTQVLLSEPVVSAIRKELKRRTNHNLDAAQITELLQSGVIRKDC